MSGDNKHLKITLLDYVGNKVVFDVGEKDSIATIDLSVITGDEIANVVYKDYSRKRFDTRDDRMTDYFDDEYELYDFRSQTNLIDNPIWKTRRSSYDDAWRETQQTDCAWK